MQTKILFLIAAILMALSLFAAVAVAVPPVETAGAIQQVFRTHPRPRIMLA